MKEKHWEKKSKNGGMRQRETLDDKVVIKPTRQDLFWRILKLYSFFF